ncbi:hypothetical protein CONPUDRAFT_135691 [Coniophora puteana RWD-64-598 SS2]|uniref:Zn(2)-C6 fungal-type domain-containing protein n=1 Tax=Coniophora puteana (strain RWD-64-598) TaxID=741705 RepID=A0A5M3MYE3_CONPW|nr:uncharacterized protein CONPUDRAFT_135691 [Coniophora puteana RWD-64-598 SS2]EIW84129.1 hypothetical protein CONPUDRAFT_135691 [Coniophora puteana RWD-64-598 SS2]
MHPTVNMDKQQQQQQQQPQQPQQQQAPARQTGKKRRNPDSNDDDAAGSSGQRRLRRSHEACARCRSKKIKCDSKHPKCTACATAGVACQQEDRHRQVLQPRGHVEHLEHRLIQCEALLKRRIPEFDIHNVDEFCHREGIEVNGPPPPDATGVYPPWMGAQAGPPFPQHPNGGPPPANHQMPKGPYGHPMMTAGYPMMHMPYPPPPPGSPYPHMHMPMQGPPGPYPPPIHPGFPPPGPPPAQAAPPPGPTQAPVPAQPPLADVKGQDPPTWDLANPQGLAKGFGVNPNIINETQLSSHHDAEDLSVGSDGLSSGRDRHLALSSIPRDSNKWLTVTIGRPATGTHPSAPTPAIWLPKDRTMLDKIVDNYFTRLNIHRPLFFREDFERRLKAVYDGEAGSYDPGFICSMYLILALGTLSELNHRACAISPEKDKSEPDDSSPIIARKTLGPDWPDHEELFDRALVVKPALRVSLSSLQALILLHWYLYTERQGRSLWRLVGSLVRLAVELNLHHDPLQNKSFTEEEAQLRIRLWGIVMVHDRGTSILLGRPLAIAPSDQNTPPSTRSEPGDFSDHFLYSHPIAEIQADIINSLYAPTRQTTDTVMTHASRIIKRMVGFRRQLPEQYKFYFGGTEEWPLIERQKLVHNITADEGLTLLKFGIARILLLRALFSLRDLEYNHRYRALVDAIVTSHNIIIIHNQLIQFPDIAFFVSPIPLHIAAMVILYGHMSHCERLSRQVMIEDVWMALDMLPRFRWRWDRKDMNGVHPLISKLAEMVLEVNLRSVEPPKDPVLLSELDWDEGMLSSPSMAPQSMHTQNTPPMPPTFKVESSPYAPQPQPGSQGGTPGKPMPGTPTLPGGGERLAEIPANLFYPFYPENPMGSIGPNQSSSASSTLSNGENNGGSHDYQQLLAAAAAQQEAGFRYPPEAYMLEESTYDPSQWDNNGERNA